MRNFSLNRQKYSNLKMSPTQPGEKRVGLTVEESAKNFRLPVGLSESSTAVGTERLLLGLRAAVTLSLASEATERWPGGPDSLEPEILHRGRSGQPDRDLRRAPSRLGPVEAFGHFGRCHRFHRSEMALHELRFDDYGRPSSPLQPLNPSPRAVVAEIHSASSAN